MSTDNSIKEWGRKNLQQSNGELTPQKEAPKLYAIVEILIQGKRKTMVPRDKICRVAPVLNVKIFKKA